MFDGENPTRKLSSIWSSHKTLVFIIAVSIFLRLVAAFLLGDQVVNLPGTYDQISYHNLAIRLVDGQGFTFDQDWWPNTKAGEPTAHWSYLYTFYLAAVYALFGVHPLIARLLQAILVGLLHPYLAYLIGERAFSRGVGLAAAMLTALYPYFIYYSATLMTEPFYITGILAVLFLSILIVDRAKDARPGSLPRRQVLAFVLLALALAAVVLLRQLFLLFVPFLFLWILWSGGKRTFLPLILTGMLVIGVILPLTYFNYTRFHRFVLLNTNSGFAFFWGNHPIYGTHFEPILPPEMGSYQELIPVELIGLDEAALDQALLKRGIGFILADPKRYLLLSISRIPAYFMFWPSSESGIVSNIARVTSAWLFWPFVLLGLVRSIKGARNLKPFLSSPIFLLILFVSIYTAIHLLSWALIRYRLPVDAVMLIFAGVAITDLLALLLGQRVAGLSRSKAPNLN